MTLRVALSPDGEAIELTLPGGGATTLRPEGHTGATILHALQAQRRAEVAAQAKVGLAIDFQALNLPEVQGPLATKVQVLPTVSRKIAGRPKPPAPTFTLEDLGLLD